MAKLLTKARAETSVDLIESKKTSVETPVLKAAGNSFPALPVRV